jgi:hypothetical protein
MIPLALARVLRHIPAYLLSRVDDSSLVGDHDGCSRLVGRVVVDRQDRQHKRPIDRGCRARKFRNRLRCGCREPARGRRWCGFAGDGTTGRAIPSGVPTAPSAEHTSDATPVTPKVVTVMKNDATPTLLVVNNSKGDAWLVPGVCDEALGWLVRLRRLACAGSYPVASRGRVTRYRRCAHSHRGWRGQLGRA